MPEATVKASHEHALALLHIKSSSLRPTGFAAHMLHTERTETPKRMQYRHSFAATSDLGLYGLDCWSLGSLRVWGPKGFSPWCPFGGLGLFRDCGALGFGACQDLGSLKNQTLGLLGVGILRLWGALSQDFVLGGVFRVWDC